MDWFESPDILTGSASSHLMKEITHSSFYTFLLQAVNQKKIEITDH